MRIVLAGALTVLLAAGAANALAELYRWRDPQTGTIKYSSYPPPWYGDESREASAPKVEVIGAPQAEGANRAPADEMAEKVAEVIRFMQQRREQLLSRMTLARASAGFNQEDAAFKADLQAYRAVTRELDKFDPKGASARRRADARAFENLGVEPQAEGARPAVAGAPPPRPVSGERQAPALPEERPADRRR